MNCADVRERSFDYFYDLLQEEERASFETHLRGCAPCGEVVRMAAEQKKLLRDAAPVPRGLTERTVRRMTARPRSWRIAAAAALLLGLGLGSVLLRGPSEILWVNAAGRRPVARGGEVGEGVVEYPDGSRARLFPRSRARVAPRGLTLDAGDAAFQVSPGREPFIVRTPAADVTVLGTEFQVHLIGDDEMNRKSIAAGSGVLLTVAVVTGIVRVSNDRGEVLLRAEESAAARTGEGPRRVTQTELDRISLETRQAEEEARALEAQTIELRRAGKALLLELRQRPSVQSPVAKPSQKSPLTSLMKAKMAASTFKTEIDKIDRRLHLTPEQRKSFEASYQKTFQGIFDLLESGDLEKLNNQTQNMGPDPQLLLLLTPEQLEEWKKMQAEESEMSLKAEQAAQRKIFDGAVEALKLTDAQKADLGTDLTRLITDTKSKNDQVLFKVFTGKLSGDAVQTERESILQGALDQMKDRLTPEQSVAFKGYLQKQFQQGSIRIGGSPEKADK
jgi:ferric-dicitrate binding protein FerR (iron transport regulator)